MSTLDALSRTRDNDGAVLVVPARIRRTHCGSLPDTPCIGRSRSSAHTLASAVMRASSSDMPTARNTFSANEWSRSAEIVSARGAVFIAITAYDIARQHQRTFALGRHCCDK